MGKEPTEDRKAEMTPKVLETMDKLGSCTLTQLAQALPEYSWNQVFLAVDQLSREGALTLRRHPHVFEYLLEPKISHLMDSIAKATPEAAGALP